MKTHDPFEGYMLLSYELFDDPGTEHEKWVEDLADARRHLKNNHMVAWAQLTNGHGDVIADTEVIV
jgi:quinol monooxygenase YgiN